MLGLNELVKKAVRIKNRHESVVVYVYNVE